KVCICICIQANSCNTIINTKTDLFREVIFVNDVKYTIIRHSDTFHQTDDNIRTPLYNCLTRIFNRNKNYAYHILFLGGEMYIFGKILNYVSASFYTDFESIYND